MVRQFPTCREDLEGRRCLFHGGVAVARCRSCKAILCEECTRGADRCPRCDAPLSYEEESKKMASPQFVEKETIIERQIIKVKCRYCGALNDQMRRTCESCGANL